MGVLFQSGALWSGLTLAENVALPLEAYTKLPPRTIAEVVALKLALVGLRVFESFYPVEISGGMRKRAALARAMALDPDVLLFDEPSSGLDPISACRLDDLILELRRSFGTTIVVVTHNPAFAKRMPRVVVMQDGKILRDERPGAEAAREEAPLAAGADDGA
jgi:phospholipid/cholesterol/gamma-HCH transport system ATP-binding protein